MSCRVIYILYFTSKTTTTCMTHFIIEFLYILNKFYTFIYIIKMDICTVFISIVIFIIIIIIIIFITFISIFIFIFISSHI